MKSHIPKPNTDRILWNMRSLHPLSVFSTTVAFPNLHLKSINSITQSSNTKLFIKTKIIKHLPVFIRHISVC
ncbi:hypothetical protein MtrunA17_Chr1g0175691 [Medicago truncatula]|uniref:Uncharacterized protein n=1 Tax=Medicago truncatula TaxID=3880 RepID=A0A396JSS5_MEDTR|nr:hypothetical protein MtrunA17_Chr1g0175691 [Medicago truncatula]